MKTVPLGGRKAAGRVALVDDEDYDLVMQYNWFVQEDTRPGHRSGPYARTDPYDGKSARSALFMHKLIAGYPKPDHIDGNGLNNQRSNLRSATATQNSMNKRKRLSASSRYLGVHWLAAEGKWRAAITCDGKKRSLGRFTSEEEAARAYDNAARETFGEYARLNFPEAIAEAEDTEKRARALATELNILGVHATPITRDQGASLEIDLPSAGMLLELLRERHAA